MTASRNENAARRIWRAPRFECLMEVPGFAPGSANPSSSASTCVFGDPISRQAGLPNGPPSASHCGFRHLIGCGRGSRLQPARFATSVGPPRAGRVLGRDALVTRPAPCYRWHLKIFPVFSEARDLGTLPRIPVFASNLVHPPISETAAKNGPPWRPAHVSNTSGGRRFRQTGSSRMILAILP